MLFFFLWHVADHPPCALNVGSRKIDTTSADIAAVARPAGETLLPEIASTVPRRNLNWPRLLVKLAAATAAVKSVSEGFVKYSDTSESEPELTETSGEDEAVSSWSRTSCTTSTAAAVAKSIGEVRPPIYLGKWQPNCCG